MKFEFDNFYIGKNTGTITFSVRADEAHLFHGPYGPKKLDGSAEFELKRVLVERLDIVPITEDHNQSEHFGELEQPNGGEIGIWIPCSKEFQALISGSTCNVQLEVVDE